LGVSGVTRGKGQGVTEVVAVVMLVVIRCAGVLGPRLDGVNPQPSSIQKNCSQLDESTMNRQETEFGAGEWKIVDTGVFVF
jgi:hypothetical protein